MDAVKVVPIPTAFFYWLCDGTFHALLRRPDGASTRLSFKRKATLSEVVARVTVWLNHPPVQRDYVSERSFFTSHTDALAAERKWLATLATVDAQ